MSEFDFAETVRDHFKIFDADPEELRTQVAGLTVKLKEIYSHIPSQVHEVVAGAFIRSRCLLEDEEVLAWYVDNHKFLGIHEIWDYIRKNPSHIAYVETHDVPVPTIKQYGEHFLEQKSA